MEKFITIFFCILLASGGVGYVYVADKLEQAFQHPTGHDIEAEMKRYALQQRFNKARAEGTVEKLFPEE